MQQPSLLVVAFLSYSSGFLQNPACPTCAGSGYPGYSNSQNPLSYFNGPTDFGNQLGKAIAASISDTYSSNSNPTSKMTFGSYPQSGYSSQVYGGVNDYGPQTYVIQPSDLYNQGMQQGASTANGFGGQTYGSQTFGTQGGYEMPGGYGNQAGYGNQGGYTFNSFPSSGYNNQYGNQPNTYNLGSYGNTGNNGYGNTNFGMGTYGIPDPITTGGVTSNAGGSCPYCFGNKGGYKTKKAKRESSTKKN